MQDDLVLHFKEDTHQYFLGDKELISVTTLMQKHGLAPKYDAVPSEVLRAKAERGTMIHKEIEEYIKDGKIGFTNELSEFIEYVNNNLVEVLKSEFRVHNDVAAGTVDLLLYKDGYILADVKTTAVLHKEAISWQLAIYAYLLEQINPSIKVNKGQAYHFDKDGNLNVVEITLKPRAEVIKLLECERNGVIYEQVLDLSDSNLNLAQLVEVETLIKNIEAQKKAAEAQAQELRAVLMEAMEKNGVTKFENERIAITYVAPTTRTGINSVKLKKDLPQIAEQYTTTTNVKASLRITIKEA